MPALDGRLRLEQSTSKTDRANYPHYKPRLPDRPADQNVTIDHST